MGNDTAGFTTVLIMEEQEIFHHAYKEIFKIMETYKLIQYHYHTNHDTLSEKLTEHKPDLLLISLKKCSAQNMELISRITGEYPRMALMLIAFTYTQDTTNTIKNMVSRRQSGMALVLKQSIDRTEQMRNMVRSVMEGQLIIDPALMGMLFTEKKTHPFLAQLTKRETEILSLVSEGYTNSAIAKELFIDIRTVQHHIENMYAKMKSEEFITDRHPRVSASRLYLETTGKLVTTK